MIPDEQGRHPLHLAAMEGDFVIVAWLLSKGADPNQPDLRGHTALHLAAQEGGLMVVEILLDAGAMVDPPDNRGNTPLLLAVLNGPDDRAVIDQLRSRGADPEHLNDENQSPRSVARLTQRSSIRQAFNDLD